jgi:hypothetical protein
MQERHHECENECGESHGKWQNDHREQRHHDQGPHAHRVRLCLLGIRLSLWV